MPKNHAAGKIHLDAALAGPLFMLAAALLFTLLNVFVKLLGPDFRIWDIGFYRFMGGALILVTVFGRRRNPYRGHNPRLLFIRGCTGSAAFIALVTAIRLLPVSTALVIFYTFPAFAAFFSFILYRDRIRLSEMACMLAVLAGVAVLFDLQLAGGLFGQVMALVGGVLAGLTVTLIKTLRAHNGPVIIYLYLCTVGAAVTLPPFIASPVWPVNPWEWGLVLGIVFASVTAQLAMNQGFFYCRGWEGGVFMSSEVVFTALVGILFLDDPTTWRFWVGGGLIFGSVVALNRLKADQDRGGN